MKLKDFEEGTHLGIVGFWLKFSIAMLLSEDSPMPTPLALMVFVGWCRYTHSCVWFRALGLWTPNIVGVNGVDLRSIRWLLGGNCRSGSVQVLITRMICPKKNCVCFFERKFADRPKSALFQHLLMALYHPWRNSWNLNTREIHTLLSICRLDHTGDWDAWTGTWQGGSWGQICDENFGDADARVSCVQMGYGDGYQLHDARMHKVKRRHDWPRWLK